MMMETELEEGEACSYFKNENNNNKIYDPDVALAYIGEKVQDVLGHLQKDFEGGLSAENLGAKYGGYGSFLSPPRQSPIWSHSRSPTQVHNNTTSKPQNVLHVKGGHHNSAVSSTVHQLMRTGAGKTGAGSLAEQRTLKVRIKLGPENLPTQKNSAIYSGLGLEISPASSLDDSLSESEGMSREFQIGPQESPTSILRIMTSFPLNDGLTLSPLPEDVLRIRAKDRKSLPVSRRSSDCVKSKKKLAGENNMKSLLRNDLSGGVKSNNDIQDVSKESDIETLACEELVSNTLKLPLLSNPTNDDTRKGMDKRSGTSRADHKGIRKNKVPIDLVKEEMLEPGVSQGNGWSEKLKPNSYGNLSEDREERSLKDDTGLPKREILNDEGKTYKPVRYDSPMGKKGKDSGQVDLPKRKDLWEVTAHDGDTVQSRNYILPSGGKRKSKVSQDSCTLAAEAAKEVSGVASSSVPKNKRSTLVDDHINKNEPEDSKLEKDLPRSKDRYREIFGDINLEDEEEDNPMDSLELPSVDGKKSSQMAAKNVNATNNEPKEKSGNKKGNKPFISESHLKAGPGFNSGPQNSWSLNAHPAIVAPVVLEENWVQCDKCQKWRLLPNGRNPDSLPEKWLCAMLDWLPGKNKCSISEEETTKALYALYQVPVPDRNNHAHSSTGGGITSVDAHSLSNDLRCPSLSESNRGKKHELDEVFDAIKKGFPSQMSNSVKNMKKSSVKSRSLNDVNHSPQVNEAGIDCVSKSTDISVEKHQENRKEKHTSLDRFSDGGDTRKLKMGNRGEPNSRPSKKMKTEALKSNIEGWTSSKEAADKITNLSNGLPTAKGKDIPKYSGSSLPSEKCDTLTSVKEPKETSRVDKKRKLKGCNGPQSYNMLSHIQDSIASAEDLRENNVQRKQKKSRISNFEARESSINEGGGKSERKGSCFEQNIKNSLSKRSCDGLESEKRESGSALPSLAATSSSSKVSGSHKSRTSFQEVKGSPVESVSSSPLRLLKPDKLSSARNSEGNEIQGNVNSEINSLKNCSDGNREDTSDQSETAEREENVTGAHLVSSNFSVLDLPEKKVDQKSNNQDCDRKKCADHVCNGGRYEKDYHANGFSTESPSKVQPKDNVRGVKSELDVNKNDIIQPHGALADAKSSHKVKLKNSNIKQHDKLGNRQHEAEDTRSPKKVSLGKVSRESDKGGTLSKSEGPNGLDVGEDDLGVQYKLYPPSEALLQKIEGKSLAKMSSAEKIDREETVSSRGKPLPLPPGVGNNETLAGCPLPVHRNQKGVGKDNAAAAVLEGYNGPKLPKVVETQHISSRRRTPNIQKTSDIDAPSPHRRDSSNQAASSSIREAKDLKHLADRLKSSGSIIESTGIYFQAALKFLLGASLLESSSSDNARHGEIIQSMQIYSSTAKLCDFCAREYEKSKDMASAALAYKCMEVAYMRVVYSSHNNAIRDRQELLTALRMGAPGQSPSSSASDVDNVNNLASVDKSALSKTRSPQVAGNPIISSQNRSNLSRLLNFTHDVTSAMEATRKSRIAFAAAKVSFGEAQIPEGVSSIKKALDFNFQDVEGLLRLVRLAMEAISRQE